MTQDISNSQHATANRNAFRIGDKVKVAERHQAACGGRGLKPGVVYTVTRCHTNASGFMVDIVANEGDRPNTGFGTDWFVHAEPVGPDYIPFTLTKATSLDYAKRSNSAKLDEEHRRTLAKAAKGQEVDAWAFHTAATAALSLAATRAGQSMSRREYTKMARHLLYISGAVISNSLRGLPPVDAGTRSPRIAELTDEVDYLRNTVNRLAEEGQRTRFALDAEQARVGAAIVEKTEAEAALVDAELRIKRMARIQSRATAQMQYALSHLDEISKAKVIGYGDALNSVEA